MFIIYKLGTCSRDLNFDFTLKDFLFWGVKLAQNADSDKYSVYSGCGIRFDLRSEFSIPNGRVGKKIIIFRDGIINQLIFQSKTKLFV